MARRIAAWLAFLVALLSSGAHAQGIALDGAASGFTASGAISSMTWNHTVGAGNDRLLVVSFVADQSGAKNISSVTYNSVPLTRFGFVTSGAVWVEMWYLINPPTGTFQTRIVFSKTTPVAAAMSFTGVRQTDPFGAAATNNATSASPSVAVASAPGELVVDALMVDQVSGLTVTAGGAQTQLWARTGNSRGAGSTQDGGDAVTMSWKLSTSRAWGLVAGSMKPVEPDAPSGLSATPISSSEINLAWTDNATNEQGYKIERKLGVGGTYAEIATVGAGVTSYSDTGLAPDTTYYYRVRAYNAGGDSGYSNEANATTLGTVTSFNAVEPAANAVTGKIFTKIAGQNFALDIVALNSSGGLATGFTGTVKVEVVDSSGGGACASLPLIAAFTNQTFVGGDAGRHPLTSNTVANVFRNARVRVSFPVASPTIVSCSGDNFAIRPASLAFAVTNANRTTAGTTNTLNNTAIAGATVHNAGRPFRIAATAYNGAGTPAITSNYDGTPTAVLAACGGTACTATTGNLDVGTWSASAGTVTSTTATYDDVGAFTLQIVDSTYAAVDASDGTPASQLQISSTAAGVGRFVPDRFLVSATSITPRSGNAACSGSSFTYMSERMDARFTLTAVKFPSGTTARYTGSLARLVLTSPASFSFGAIDSAAPTLLSARLDTSLGSSGTWSNGVADVVAVIAVQRAATPDGPYGSVRIGIAPSDPDAVVLDAAALNLDADNNGSSERAQVGATTAVRFGRLRLQHAYGSQLIAMPIPVQVQHWNGTAFVTNTADSCTSLAVGNVALGNYQRNLNSGETTVLVAAPIAAGVGALRLTAPGAANNGSVDVSINLTTGTAGASCTAGMPASTASGLSYLQGAWCGAAYTGDPTARATFGVYRNSDQVVYRRENL